MAQNNPIKVCIGIPNNGYTSVESYENRLVNFLYLGSMQEISRFIRIILARIDSGEISIELGNKLLEDIQKDKAVSGIVAGQTFEFYFMVVGRLFTPLAREECVKYALNAGCDYLFMIDDDMICPNDLFEKLYRHNVDIVGPLMFTRNPPHKPVIYSCMDGWDTVEKQSYFINHYVMNYPKDKLIECDAFGFGCALIKMDVFKKMGAPYFALCSNTGEDILFCYNAKKHGFRVHVDTSVKLGHLGNPICVTEEYAQNVWKQLDMDVEKKHGAYQKYEAKEPVC